MNEELYLKYPNLKDRLNARLIKIKIAPIGKASKHKNSLSLTREAAEKLIFDKKLSHMPIHYTKTLKDILPTQHGELKENGTKKYIEIGHLLSDGEIVLENGIEYLEADGLLHSESQKEYVEEIIAQKDNLGNSWELIPAEGYSTNGVTNITKVDDFIGNGILDKNFTAFEGTKIVYAAMEEEIDWQIKYAELMVEKDNLIKNQEDLIRENNTLYDRLSIANDKCNMYSDMMNMYKELLSDNSILEEDDYEMVEPSTI